MVSVYFCRGMAVGWMERIYYRLCGKWRGIVLTITRPGVQVMLRHLRVFVSRPLASTSQGFRMSMLWFMAGLGDVHETSHYRKGGIHVTSPIVGNVSFSPASGRSAKGAQAA